MTEQEIEECIRHERELLTPACRADPGRVAELLAADFLEIGASGRLWDRRSLMAALAEEDDPTTVEAGANGAAIEDSQMHGRVVADGLVLLTYRSWTPTRSAMRSSWWQRQEDGWRLRFHQGTVLPPDADAADAAEDRDDRAPQGTVRYGVFLVPDAQTCAAVTTITTQVEAQYGLVSARAFPPHVTLVGSLPLAGDPAIALDALLAGLDEVVADRPAFPLANRGIVMLGNSVVYDVHELADGPNRALLDLVADVSAAVAPMLRTTAPGVLRADVRAPGAWHGHLSLASHEMDERPDLRDEVLAYTRALDVPVPATSRAEVVALYRFEHPDWRARWWTDLRWTHLRSWRLTPGVTAGSARRQPTPGRQP